MKLCKKYQLYILAVIISSFVAICVYKDLFYFIDRNLSDMVYQREQALDRRIVLLGIDDASLEYFGPIQTWTRDIYADAVAFLNQDPDHKPIAVGIDVLFAGRTDEEIDDYFVETCEEYGNVVLGALANFTNELVVEDGENFYINDYYIDSYEEPFDELKAVTHQGFLNNMLDRDGIFRTGILKLDLEDGRSVDSLSYTLYKMYAKAHGIIEHVEDIVPMNDRYQWYVPFSGEPGAYESYSLSDLFTGNLTGADLADCIVIIGPFAEGLQDSFFSAIDHSRKMYGIEIHANLIDALIRQDFKQTVPNLWQSIVLFFLLFGVIVIFHKCKILHTTIIWVGAMICHIVAVLGIFEMGYVLHIIYLPVSITVIYIVQVGVKYVSALLEKRKTMNTFKRYVAPQVVDEIMKMERDDLGLGGKMTDIACLFVDIRGFTPMSEVLEPTQVVEILNTYLSLTSKCIMDNGGTLDKFIGDATMAIFNAPLPLDDYVYFAVKAALDMVKGSEKLSQELFEKFGRTIHFGVGVHCGKAVVGNIGPKIRMDYTAIGDTVNTAARLESNAKPKQILISKDVYDKLEGRIVADSLGTEIKLKGKSEGFEIFSVKELI